MKLSILILSSILFCSVLSAQTGSGSPNCQQTYELTNRTTEQTDGITVIAITAGAARIPQINNKNLLCNSWLMTTAVDGLSVLSLSLQDGQNTYTVGGGTATSWTNWEGTILSGSNPTTAITSSTLAVTGYYPWVSINLASSTGTGSIYITLYGWKTPSLLGATTINGTVCFISGTCTITGGPTGAAGGDLSGTYPNPTVAKVNSATYPAGPSVNTVPVVTNAATGGTITYEAVPNAALANSTIPINGTTCTLGSVCNLNTIAVDSSILVNSLGTRSVCALHTDSTCNNSSTDAVAANCPAGTLSATCTFPTSLTIAANALGSNIASLYFVIGHLGTSTLPSALIEVYLDSTRIFAGITAGLTLGSRSNGFSCAIGATASSTTAPVFMTCNGIGNLGSNVSFGANTLNINTAPAISINTTISHVLKVSITFSANTTGNLAWLYGMRFEQ